MSMRRRRILRDAGVWHRGAGAVRSAYRSKVGYPFQKLTAIKSRRRGGRSTRHAASELDPSVTARQDPTSKQCGVDAELQLSLASRLHMIPRADRDMLPRFCRPAELGSTGLRDLSVWRRGAEFVNVASGARGAFQRFMRHVFQSPKQSSPSALPLPSRSQGRQPEALRVYLTNLSHRRWIGSASGQSTPAARRSRGWSLMRRQLKSIASSPQDSKSFRDAKIRLLGLGLLAKLFRRVKRRARPQDLYRPATCWLPMAVETAKTQQAVTTPSQQSEQNTANEI